MQKPILITLTALSLTACHHHRKGNAADQTRAAALGVIAAFNRQDAHATAAYDAPDYLGLFHGTANTIGPAADEAGLKAQMSQARVDWQLGKDQVTVSRAGDIGIFEAPYTFVINIPGAPTTTERGTWVAIFKRQGDGQMKLWRSIASDGPAAAPAPAPAPAASPAG